MTPSELDVLAALVEGPKPWRALEAATGRHGRTVRRALDSLGAFVSKKLEGVTFVYLSTEEGKAALAAHPSPMGGAHGRPTQSAHPTYARGVSSTSLSLNGIEEKGSSSSASRAHGSPMGAAHGQELIEAHERLTAYAKRLEDENRELRALLGRVSPEKPVEKPVFVEPVVGASAEDELLVLERFAQMADDGKPVRNRQVMRARVLNDMKDSGYRAALENSREERLKKQERLRIEAERISRQKEEDARRVREHEERERVLNADRLAKVREEARLLALKRDKRAEAARNGAAT